MEADRQRRKVRFSGGFDNSAFYSPPVRLAQGMSLPFYVLQMIKFTSFLVSQR